MFLSVSVKGLARLSPGVAETRNLLITKYAFSAPLPQNITYAYF